MEFFDLFQETEAYPDNVAEQGVPQNMLYKYVSSTFLNGYINYVTPFWACVLERYATWENFDIAKVVAETIKQRHIHLSDFDDDVLILAETENSYWFFWFDCDVSDCQIGRVLKKLTTKDDMRELLIAWIQTHKNVDRFPKDSEHFHDYLITRSIVGNYYEFPVECFNDGWTSF